MRSFGGCGRSDRAKRARVLRRPYRRTACARRSGRSLSEEITMSAWYDLLRDLDAHAARRARQDAAARRKAHVPIARPVLAKAQPRRLSLFDRAQAGLKLLTRDHSR